MVFTRDTHSERRQSVLRTGKRLNIGDKLLSQNGQYLLEYMLDGDLVLCGPGLHKLWATNTAGILGGYAEMQTDGHFCLYKPDGEFCWGTGVHGFADGSLVVRDDGALAVNRGDGSVAWTSTTGPWELQVGQRLTPGQTLTSRNQKYKCCYQTDGNLVVFEPGKRPVWSSRTPGKPAGYAEMQDDGHFCLYKPGGEFYWGTGVHGFSDGKLVLMDDMSLVVFTSNGVVAWSSKPKK